MAWAWAWLLVFVVVWRLRLQGQPSKMEARRAARTCAVSSWRVRLMHARSPPRR